tara:strand:+ start:6934 stop:7881 length:948 start_codon:yes stop_codon:yes gene_type:complete
MDKNILFVEKYRPQTIQDCILPDHMKSVFSKFVQQGVMPNLLLTGSAGVGKTTVAKALCNELGYDVMFINCSEERGIDTLRTKMMGFCSTVSMTDDRKCLILDEADYLTPDAQAALRAFIEQFAQTCSFVMTCNFKNRLIPPLHSRTTVIDFKIGKKELPTLAAGMMNRIMGICEQEGITVEDKKIIAEVVTKYFPDFRRTLNEIQRYSIGGTIDTGILAQIQELNTNDLIPALKEKNFKVVRKWVADNSDVEMSSLYKKLYDELYKTLDQTNQSIPQMVLLMARYQYQSAFVADQELNLTACLVEIMGDCTFKD